MKLINIVCVVASLAEQNQENFEIEFPSNFKVVPDKEFNILVEATSTSTSKSNQTESTSTGMGMARSTRTDSVKNSKNPSIERKKLKKYEAIKKMTIYLHDENEREWGRYCPYGCHCAVAGPTDLMSGSGHPIDEIDSACKRHKECMQCAINDFGESSCPWWKPYKMQAMFDDVTNQKFLVCSK